MFQVGERVLFRVDTSSSSEDYREFYLNFLESDDIGIMMQGEIPRLWSINADRICGPCIFDDDYQYRIVKVDYESSLIWVECLD